MFLDILDHWLVKVIVSAALTLFGVPAESVVLVIILFTVDMTIAGVVRLTRPAAVSHKHLQKEILRIIVFSVALLILNLAANGDPLLRWMRPFSFTLLTVLEILYILKGLSLLDNRVLIFRDALRSVLRRNTDADLKAYVGAIVEDDAATTTQQTDGRVDPPGANAD